MTKRSITLICAAIAVAVFDVSERDANAQQLTRCVESSTEIRPVAPIRMLNVSSAPELAEAFKVISGGEVITIAPGHYGSAHLTGLLPAREITLRSSERLGAVFTDFRISRSSQINLDGVRVEDTMRVDNGAHQLTFVNSSFGSELGSSDGTGFYARDVSHIRIDKNDIAGGKYSLILNDVQYFEVSNNLIRDARIDLMRVTGNSHHGLVRDNTLRDVRPLKGDHNDGMQFFAVNGYTPHDITIRGNYLYDDPATGDMPRFGMQGIFLKDTNTGFRNFLIENNLIASGSPNSIYVQDGKENVAIRKNTLLSWKADGGGAAIRLVGSDNSGTTVDGNIMLKLLHETGDASIGNNFLYSNNRVSPRYWGKLFNGPASRWEGFIPQDGSPVAGGRYGAHERITELRMCSDRSSFSVR